MAWYLNGTSSYIRGGGLSPLNGNTSQLPATFSAWVWWDQLGANTDIIAVRDAFGNTASNRSCIRLFKNTSDQIVAQYAGTSSAQNSIYTASTVSSGKWHHVAGVFTSSSLRVSFLDGQSATPNTTSQTGTQVTSLQIGAAYSAADPITGGGFFLNFLAGHMAHVAVWVVALTDQEIRMLAAGAIPTSIRPYDLGAYFPCDEPNVAQPADWATAAAYARTRQRRLFTYDTVLGEEYYSFDIAQSGLRAPVAGPVRPLPGWVRPAITNKLRAQAAFLKPYTGILPIPNG